MEENKDLPAFTYISKREYFAGLAMQGLMINAKPSFCTKTEEFENLEKAKFAVRMADALLTALEE